MKDLYLFFTPFDDLFFTVPRLFYQNRQALADQGILYHWLDDPRQAHRMHELGYRFSILADPARPQSARAVSRQIIGEALHCLQSDAPRQILVVDLQNRQSLVSLKAWLQANHPDFRLHAALVAQRQDMGFCQNLRRLWRSISWQDLHDRIMARPDALNYYETFKGLQDLFGKNQAAFIEYASLAGHVQAQENLASEVAAFIGTDRAAFADLSPWPLPASFAGLDMLAATSDFPFSFNGRQVHDRQAFNELLQTTERRENFPQFSGQPLKLAADVLAQHRADNAALGQLLGKQIFQDGSAPIEDAPDELPDLTAEQAYAFVAAMDENLRQALLRHLRDDLKPLTEPKKALAQGLALFQKKQGWRTTFSLPRSKADLAVLTMTRNHKNFISQCLESVASQKTDFAIEHIIVDDCSDDGTQDIIDDFASRHPHVRPIYLPRRSGKGENVRALFSACKSPYAALCDGDDYFTDPRKLQLQFDYLQGKPGCAICFHPVQVDFEDDRSRNFIYPPVSALPQNRKSGRYYIGDLLKGNFMQTNSVVYRWRFASGLPDWFQPALVPGDWYWHLLHAETGSIGMIPGVMSVYRRHAGAFYNNAFIDPQSHRLVHGMKELETFQILNSHFKGKYFNQLSSLANGVFVNFLELQIKNDDSSLLDAACEKFPDFAMAFLKNLKIANKGKPGAQA